MKKGKIAFYGLVVFGVGLTLFDLILNSLKEQMTISQMALDAGQRHFYIIILTIAFFVWLVVHLFWRWKKLWNFIWAKIELWRTQR